MYDRSGAMAPTTIYGIYKAANEDTARIYWEECGVPSVGYAALLRRTGRDVTRG